MSIEAKKERGIRQGRKSNLHSRSHRRIQYNWDPANKFRGGCPWQQPEFSHPNSLLLPFGNHCPRPIPRAYIRHQYTCISGFHIPCWGPSTARRWKAKASSPAHNGTYPSVPKSSSVGCTQHTWLLWLPTPALGLNQQGPLQFCH